MAKNMITKWYKARFQEYVSIHVVVILVFSIPGMIVVLNSIFNSLVAIKNETAVDTNDRILVILVLLCVVIYIIYRILNPNNCIVAVTNDGLLYKPSVGKTKSLSWEELRSIIVQEVPFSDGTEFLFKEQIIITRIKGENNILGKEKSFGSRKVFYLDCSDDLLQEINSCYPDEVWYNTCNCIVNMD